MVTIALLRDHDADTHSDKSTHGKSKWKKLSLGNLFTGGGRKKATKESSDGGDQSDSVKSSYHGKSQESDGHDDLDIKNRGYKRRPELHITAFDNGNVDIGMSDAERGGTPRSATHNASASTKNMNEGSPIAQYQNPAADTSDAQFDSKIAIADASGHSRKREQSRAAHSSEREIISSNLPSIRPKEKSAVLSSIKSEKKSSVNDDEFDYDNVGNGPLRRNDTTKMNVKGKNDEELCQSMTAPSRYVGARSEVKEASELVHEKPVNVTSIKAQVSTVEPGGVGILERGGNTGKLVPPKRVPSNTSIADPSPRANEKLKRETFDVAQEVDDRLYNTAITHRNRDDKPTFAADDKRGGQAIHEERSVAVGQIILVTSFDNALCIGIRRISQGSEYAKR